MPVSRLPLPLPDYQRLFRVMKTVLDGAGANTAHGCIHFSVIGAFIVEHVYKKKCQPVAGAAFYRVDDPGASTLSFADGDEKEADLSSYDGFHCWILCEDHIIDFTAPLFPELIKEKGATGNCSRKMFQRPRAAMVDSPLLMTKPGDFYLLPNVNLTSNIMRDFMGRPVNEHLVKTCATWYKRPPKNIGRQMQMQGGDGRLENIALSDMSLIGAW